MSSSSPLHFEIDILRGKSGDIALGAREARNDSDADWVGDGAHDDRDRAGRAAIAVGVPQVTMMSTGTAASSAASAG